MIVEEEITNSYEFSDEKQTILLTLYAHGAFEQKSIEVFIDTDSIEVRTPRHECWKFQLYDHVFSDRPEVETHYNAAMTQTAIEIRLYKQKARLIWPQIHSLNSTPIVPNRDETTWHDCQDVNMNDDHFIDLSTKKLNTNFYETNDKFTWTVYIKQVKNHQANFTETNFTLTFQTSDETFLSQHSIQSDDQLRLFVRVKERIIPSRCTCRVTTTMIEIVLFKENSNAKKWDRLEASEHSEIDQTRKVSNSPITSPISPKTIPLPPPMPPPSLTVNRQSDKFPSASDFNSAIERKENKGYASSNNIVALGFTGLNNPANSCFMNAAIQCLSNTRELRDYFLQSYYLLEINKVNPLGMKGVMAEEFGSLMKNLWNTKLKWINGNGIRSYVAKRHQEFANNGQHDAQELLTILLDAIHEDLNRIISKPLVPPVEDQGRPDQIVADEYWRGYLSRNDSIIVQLFTGQFKSKTKCPQCHKESVTFDPFTSLSVPLPKRTAVDVIVLYRTDEKVPTKYRLIISSDGTINELKRLVSTKTSLSSNKMIAYRVRGNRIIEFLKDDERVPILSHSINNSDVIFIAETLTSDECRNERIFHLTFFQRVFKISNYVKNCDYCHVAANPHKPSICCQNCYQTFYCDESCQRLHYSEHKKYCGLRSADNYENIGIPFVISLPQSKLNCENVFEQLKIYAKRSVSIHIPSSTVDDDEDSFSDIESVDWPTIKETLASADSWSICRLGDYFVQQGGKKKRRRPQSTRNRKEKMAKNKHLSNGDHHQSDDDDDPLDIIYAHQRLFRLMPHTSTQQTDPNLRPIIEPGDEADEILHRYSIFSMDWFTDNKREAPLQIVPARDRHGINGLVEDRSVTESTVGDQDITLQQCLQTFIEPEILGEDNKWYCPRCKEHMRAEKKMSVWRLPPILIIQLKRFKYHHGCSGFGYLSDSRVKIDTNVKFPVYNLDMTPFCSSTTDSSQSRYDLFGVINHRGSAWFGHYTSHARLLGYNDPAKTEIGWRHFDDEYVTNLVNEKDLNRPDAYVLFYRHRHLPVHLNLPSPPTQPVTTTSNVELKDNYEEPISMETNSLDDIRDLLN